MPLPSTEPSLPILPALAVRLRSIAKILWIPWALQGAFGFVWVETPVLWRLGGMVLAIPFAAGIGLALSQLRSRWAKIALLVLLFVANSAQYTFASFYGRFIRSGELSLMASNSASELARSVSLYFSPLALLASFAVVSAYAALTIRPPANGRRKRWVTLGLLRSKSTRLNSSH